MTSFQSTPDFMTLRFSIDVTLLRRVRASSKATRRDALDLEGVVDLRVDGALLAVAEVADLLRLAEIDAAGQLAQDEDVEALDQLALQRGGVGERRIDRWPAADWRTAPRSLRSRSRPASGRTS